MMHYIILANNYEANHHALQSYVQYNTSSNTAKTFCCLPQKKDVRLYTLLLGTWKPALDLTLEGAHHNFPQVRGKCKFVLYRMPSASNIFHT